MNAKNALRKAAIGLSLVIALAIPASAMATDSGPVTETLKVLPSFTLTGVPASPLSFPDTTTPGTATKVLQTSPAFTISFFSSNGAGTTLTMNGTDLTAGAGKTITKNNRWIGKVPPAASGITTTIADGGGIGDGTQYADNLVLATQSGAGVGSITLAEKINVPANQLAGNYSGTITFSVN